MLLKQQKAAVFRRFPFTIILKERTGGQTQPIQLKFDPGSKTTGIALVADFKKGKRCIWAAELTHRGCEVRKRLEQRKNARRSRRFRHTRYRKARFLNRVRPQGWLAPSLKSRVDNIASWTKKLRDFSPVTSLSMELVRFDMQKLNNPENAGVLYQQGELMGYEVREYLLEKWGRKCAYCGKEGIPLQVEHIHPKAKGGSNRVSNLTLACERCNQRKGDKDIKVYLKKNPALLERILKKTKVSLADAAAVNTTRNAVKRVLEETGLVVEVGSGGLTKYNRIKQGYAKAHWLDAVCVGESGGKVFVQEKMKVLEVKAMGRGDRQMCKVDKRGFPRTGPKANKRVKGFQTGDMVVAVVTKGKKKGRYVGRVAIRTTGNFNIKVGGDTTEGISYKYCRILQYTDGYAYHERKDGASSPL